MNSSNPLSACTSGLARLSNHLGPMILTTPLIPVIICLIYLSAVLEKSDHGLGGADSDGLELSDPRDGVASRHDDEGWLVGAVVGVYYHPKTMHQDVCVHLKPDPVLWNDRRYKQMNDDM